MTDHPFRGVAGPVCWMFVALRLAQGLADTV